MDDYDKEMVELENFLEVICLTTHPLLKMIVEKKANSRQNNFSTTGKISLYFRISKYRRCIIYCLR